MDEFEWIDSIDADDTVTMDNAYVGMRVKISPDSEFYNCYDDSCNPCDVVGELIVIRGDSFDDGFVFVVMWSEYERNDYRVGDLIKGYVKT